MKIVEHDYNRKVTFVKVNDDDLIGDVIVKALEKTLLKRLREGTVAPDLVTVNFEGNEIRPDAKVSEYETSYENPLLLTILDEGMLNSGSCVSL